MCNRTQISQRRFIRRSMAAALLIALHALALSACGSDATPTPAVGVVVVESGVTPLTPSALRPGGDAEADNTAAAEIDNETEAAPSESEESAPAPISDGFPILNVDDEVIARGILRIYAAAEPNVPTLDEYAAGDRFIILGPPDDVTIYPVELAGVRWYRVRATDGLAGWVIADGIEPVVSEEP